jgi:hypothetical protein|tara:strand:+ start:331 stop:441 length:111 start_codon:yes stop_codon:yes gene_type:complete
LGTEIPNQLRDIDKNAKRIESVLKNHQDLMEKELEK